MGNLPRFLAAARERVARGDYALRGPALRPHGSLRAALAGSTGPIPILAELKPRSPSEGRLLEHTPDALLQAYRQGGAAALSILADASFFDGSPDLVRTAHAHGLPVLFKDFVVDEAQVACAAHNGASAILLIERAFAGQPQRREALVQAAHEAGLEVLLELFDEADLRSTASSQADLLGVNARDLDTLAMDLDGALHLIRTASQDRPTVALSGIQHRTQARAARQAGACGALVGTHLMRSPDPALALKALRRPLAKTCGLRTPQDVQAASAAGADLVGFIVGSPDSPREVAPLHAQRLANQAQGLGLRTVLVTRSTTWPHVLEWCRLVRPDFVQVHGLAPAADWHHRLAQVPTRLLAAIGPGQAKPDACDGVVVDSTTQGGSGKTHDWARVGPGFSLVAGGLHAGNVADALQATLAWGADASSGLESRPGEKDPVRVAQFVQAVHAA